MSLKLKHIRNDVHVLRDVFIVTDIGSRVHKLINLHRQYVEDSIVNVFSHQINISGDHIQELVVVGISTTQRHRIVKFAESKCLISYHLEICRIFVSAIDTSIPRVAFAIILLIEIIENTLATIAACSLRAFISSDLRIERLSINWLNLSEVLRNL